MRRTKRMALCAAAAIAVTASAGAGQAVGVAGPGTASPARSPGSAWAAAGVLWAWGSNFRGDLGDGTLADRGLPVKVKVSAGTKITAAAGGDSHSVAVTSTGRVLAWGNNFSGQLGDGSTQISHVPVQVLIPAGVTITAVQAGCADSMALTSTGRVLDWGRNAYGELGDGTRTASDVPVWVHLPKHTTVTAIGAGCDFDLALTSTGKVLAWGRGGSLGNNDGASRLVPIRVRLPRSVKITAIAAGQADSVGVTATGQVYTWAGLPGAVAMPPKSQVGRVTAVAAGSGFDFALTSRGIVLAWGGNNAGSLGDGTTTGSSQPVRVRLPSNVRASAISASAGTGFAITRTGQLLAWGHYAALGDGGGPDTDIPIRTELPPRRTVIAIAAGSSSYHAFAIVR